MRVIVHTRPDGGVDVTYPAPGCLRALTGGGYPWSLRGSTEAEQIERLVAGGTPEGDAARWVRALGYGGCTDAEAYDLIRWRSVPPGHSGVELWDADAVPADRWFRDAWGRSANGGPISVRLPLARPIQARRIADAIALEQRAAAAALLPMPCVDLPSLRRGVAVARDEGELRAVWPVFERMH